MKSIDFYSRPAWYDALHDDDTSSWADFLERLNAEHGTGGRDWLEPACGTGRFLRALGPRGYRVTGYDASRRMLAYARARRTPGELRLSGMTRFVRPGAFDFAFNVLGSIRHLSTEAATRRHLELTRRSLKTGGIYVVGLDLVDYRYPEPDEETWQAKSGRTRLVDVVETVTPDPRARRERVIHFLTTITGRASRRFMAEYDLRSYDVEQWTRLVKSAGFSIAAAYSPWRKRVELDETTRDVTVVLS